MPALGRLSIDLAMLKTIELQHLKESKSLSTNSKGVSIIRKEN